MNIKEIRNALQKAKYHYNKGKRHYEEFNNTYHSCPKHIDILSHVSLILECYGVECIENPDNCNSPSYSYVNTGDTYTRTLLYNHKTGRYLISSWGDIVEQTLIK